jgi:hypothetical protein
MRATPQNFARAHKSVAGYPDLPANARGTEKGFLVCHALGRVQSTRPKAVQVGPDGGAAVSFLAAPLARDPNERVTVHLTLIKAPGVVLQSLTQSVEEFNRRNHRTSDLER